MSLLAGSILPNMNLLLPHLISQFGSLIYLGLFALIFIETGLVLLPFLPGDSLLFLCGSLAAISGRLNFWLLLCLLSLAAVLGDAVNFEIGEHLGQRLAASKRLRRFLKPSYLQRSQNFFQAHGQLAIFLGRFIPIIRTFIPFTAGISSMHYPTFLRYNLLGGLAWVTVGLGAGYLFGNIALVKNHFELIMLAIILISLLPAAILALRKKGASTDEEN